MSVAYCVNRGGNRLIAHRSSFGYQQLIEYTVTANGFTADESLASVLPKLTWVNLGFYRYMLGDFK